MLTGLAGPSARLRPDQEAAVAAVAEPGARALVVQATGWGKSAVYFGATAVRRAEGAGPTLVVSPLLSLMRDQVEAATRAGLRAATLNSANLDQWGQVEHDLLAGRVDLLLVSPERLANPSFGRRVLDALTGRLGLLVIDEAHSLSDWGHDFRPDYRRIAGLLLGLGEQVPVLMTTATANQRVTDDLAQLLGAPTLVQRGDLARASLTLTTVPGLTPLQRYGWVADNLNRLPGSGIVYALTVAEADRLAEVLRAEGHDVRAYSSRLEPAQRQAVEEALRRNEIKAVVATSALGMGFDKPDLGFVVHVGAPPSPVAYYQQVGRAGRGIDHAVVVLLASSADEGLWEHYITSTVPVPTQVNALLKAMGDEPGAASVPSLEAGSGLRRGRVELLLKQLAVDGAVAREESGWRPTGQAWAYDEPRYTELVAARRREAEVMRGYARGEACLMQTLQRALDDPAAEPCGRCSVCIGHLPDGLAEQVPADVLARVGALLRRRVSVVEPRKMWPGGRLGRGRIALAERCEPGRALAFADAPEWSELVGESFGPAVQAGGPLPDQLVQATVATLAGWKQEWAAAVGRPEVVLSLPVSGFGPLTRALAARIGQIGRMPVRHLEPAGRLPVEGQSAAAAEAEAWLDLLAPAVQELVADQPLADGPVLLVADRSSTLWAPTVAASLLRRAGATAVYPLVVHRTP